MFLLTPLRETQYSIKNTKDFKVKIENEMVPNGSQMIPFDRKSFFTTVF